MIEVEIKVCVTDAQKAELIKGAQLIAQEVLIDEYYDSADFNLTTNGYWLRRRNGEFELKLPATKSGGFNVNKNIPMQEIYDKKIIAQTLGLNLDCGGSLEIECDALEGREKRDALQESEAFELALEKAGYKVLYKFVNTRKSYTKDGFKIDLDIADFGDLVYEACEIEIEVDFKEQTGVALESLYEFVRGYGICTDKAESKLSHYIRRSNPVHYQAIINSSKSSE